ncbi:Asp-tRNA(Asn)/Glu-tRNA(Gln) amidotransferase subunit GatC [Archaeoglobus veneficus]|uniref:Aspartyl/glutamyl-tRNA(Asn/Gln) amidotransferase subunit C n=1 Tax=Archaeoglobus veneficus (strain DSM 11195 / SNP6) TaxID=693661 RepID=F2KPF7_ARCVS|nr:Asp-tRNA(Asn)/Glu-tRNA(Gln) amidotransferase subunit GatC [Archaeoglobus veneficus]AEA46388.1 Aspartyl/glutamyl-tRNA(Asn/Gln) amidotransferase subunit C [Archaeoglobus veneficus SNP6]
MITEEDVYKIAGLAKIEIKPEEVENFRKEFQSILEYFNILDEVTEDVEPTFHVLPISNVFRDDVPKPCLSREEALKNAKHIEDGYFKGPRVVE